MHELSIAASIVQIATEKLAEHGGERVVAVRIRVGPIACVAKEALMFSFGLACADTPAEGASLVIEDGEGADLDFVQMEIEP